MTKEPIIIDGVNVSGCDCIIEDYQRANNVEGRYEHIKNVCELGERGAEYYNLFCKDNPNCHYKNWQRKEQECEKIKKELDIISCANIELSLEVKKYEKAINEIEEIADDNYENPEMERIFNIIGGLDV